MEFLKKLLYSKKTTIEDFPNNILVEIFREYIKTEGPLKFLKNIPKVCKKWNELAANISLYDEVTLKSLQWNFDDLLKLGEKGHLSATRFLNLSTNATCASEHQRLMQIRPKLKPVDFVKLAPHSKNLLSIDISKNKIGRSVLDVLCLMWPEISHVTMKRVTDSNDDFDDVYGINTAMKINSSTIDPVFINWGKKLKYLNLSECNFDSDDEMMSKLANNCSLIEELYLSHILCHGNNGKIICPIAKLQNNCPKLRVLHLEECEFMCDNVKDLVGFKEIKNFKAKNCVYNGLKINQILKNSSLLQYIDVDKGIKTISNIPTEHLKVLRVTFEKGSSLHLAQALKKWRMSLKEIAIRPENNNAAGDVTYAIDCLLKSNQEPVLERLDMGFCSINLAVLKECIRVCNRLNFLACHIGGNVRTWQNRKSMMDVLSFRA